MKDVPSQMEPLEEKNLTSHPVDRGWSWLILAASWLNMFFVVGMYKTFGILFIEFQKKYKASSSMTSLTIGLLNFGYSLSTLFVTSVLLRKFSSRQCVMAGSVSVCIVYVIATFAPSIEVLVFSYGLLLGCSQAIILAPSMTLLGQYFDKRRGLANCIAQAGASAGSLVFPVLIRALLNTYSLHGTLLFVGAMNLHMLVSGSLLRPLSFYKKKVVKDKRVINENGHIRHEELPIRTQNTLKDKIENVTVLLDKNGVTIHKTEDKNLNIIIEQENKYIKFDGSIDTKLSQYSKTSEQLNGNHATNISNGIAKNHQVISNNTVNDLKHTYRSATEVREPLLYYSPTVARAILGRKSKERYYPELGSSSTLGAFVAGMSTSSIGRYASSELSVSSALDLRDKDTISHHKQDNTDDKPTETTLCCIQRTPGSSSVFDCSVLKRLPFWFFLPTACLLCSSCSMVLVFLPPHARDKGLTDSEITVLMSTIGGIDVVALLVWGVIADCGCMKRYQLVMVAALIFGVAIHLSPLYDNFSSFMAVSVVVGLIGRVYFSLYPVLLVDFLGLEYLRSALGLTIMAQTCFVAFIVPLIGLMRDSFGSYIPGFHLMGTMMFVGGLWLLTMPLVEKYEKRKHDKEKAKNEAEVDSDLLT